MVNTSADWKWTFQRLGGLDQAILCNSEDFYNLATLDPKLWVALSCPTTGLEFDPHVLQLIDTDHDGRIRVAEVIEAVNWLCARLKDPACIIEPQEAFPLSLINTETEEGARVDATARVMLESLGTVSSDAITAADAAKELDASAKHMFNGDGVIPPMEGLEAPVRQYVKDVISIMGGVKDSGGDFGITRELSAAFVKSAEDWLEWRKTVGDTASPLGSSTAEAWDALNAIAHKVDDYFIRCELACYAPQAIPALNVDEKWLVPEAHGILEEAVLSELPLSRIEPERALTLCGGINPVWRERVERFFKLAAPLFKEVDCLDGVTWKEIKAHFTAYADALSKRPALQAFEVAQAGTADFEALGEERVREILTGTTLKEFEAVADQDSAIPASIHDIADVERLVLYYRYLYRLLLNFVSFYDFYSLDKRAAFQVGTLYIDGRACKLCLPVADIAKHSVLANYSQMFLIYCQCKRIKKDAGAPDETQTIVAAMTAGDSDLLLESRNGVFVDAFGNDWDASVVKIISNPISLREAVWSPYKKMSRMVSDQINKLAGDKHDAVISSAGKTIGTVVTNPVTAPAAVSAGKFDIGKSVGIFAAVGLALGAIGTAVASIASSLLAMTWWQFPILIGGIFLIISGPSVVLAWLKLRKRTLGPLLEASGWAINGKVKINYLLGGRLTDEAVLPPNATRSYTDPLRGRSSLPWVVAGGAILAGALGVLGWFWFTNTGFFKEEHVQPPAAKVAIHTEAKPAAPAPAVDPVTGK